MNFFSVQKQLSADIGAVRLAENTHGKLGTPRAHQAGNTYHLAFSHFDGHIVAHFPLRVKRVMYRPVFYFHIYVADLYVVTLRETVCQLTANHSLNNSIL